MVDRPHTHDRAPSPSAPASPAARTAAPTAPPARPDAGAVALAAAFERADAAGYGPVPIWWWSGARVERHRLRWQMEQMLSQGVAQAVIMNLAPTGPLYGSLADDPPFLSEAWWELFLGACADAAELGFRFWPYDQIGFSGANLQGRLVTENPDWAGWELGRVVSGPDDGPGPRVVSCPHGAVALGAYALAADGGPAVAVTVADGTARWDGDGRLALVFAHEQGFDYFNATACAGLIDTVHGAFARRAGQWFGSVIVGFFQDELPAMPTWGPDFAASFAAEHGYALTDALAALWGDPVAARRSDGGVVDGAHVRLDYHRHRAALSRRAFFDPLRDWFAEHDLVCGFDQQSPAREGDPAGSAGLYGDYLGTHAGFGAPGSDHWGDPKVHSSMAHAHDRPRTWIEAFHSSGWGGTLEETYDWLAPFLRRGATLYDPHAVYYATPGGWWEWAPPSTCWRQPYWPDYHVLADAVARLCALLSTGDHVADTVLLFPTGTAQAGMTLDGPLPEAVAAGAVYHEVNGVPAWYAEKPGVLERAGLDHAVLDEATLAAGTVGPDGLRVNRETYRNVVLPASTALDARTAAVLADLADAGDRVVCVGAPPRWFPGDDGTAGARFLGALRSGLIRHAASAEEVPGLLLRGPVHIEADAPALLRRVGDTWVVTLFAHDDRTGTVQPVIDGGDVGDDWIRGSWDGYWGSAAEHGYTFRPVTGRTARLTVHGLTGAGAESGDGDGIEVQQWDPRDGGRRTVPAVRGADGSLTVETAFTEGSVAVLVLGDALPAVTAVPPGPATDAVELTGWRLEARSRLDNTWGDVGPRDRREVLPIEVWEFDYAEGAAPAAGDWRRVTAGYGPFALVAGPLDATGGRPWTAAGPTVRWERAEWSLSRGIENDPAHGETLGPKGYVPEEFLAWPAMRTGQWAGVRTVLDVPAGGPSVLAVGGGAPRTVLVDGEPAAVAGDGYWTTSPIGPGGGRVVEIWFRAVDDGAVRASFALVADTEAYRRPEWLEPDDGTRPASTLEVATTFTVDAPVADARVQIGSEQPCVVLLNGVEVSRQSAFDPYGERRFARLHPYDLAPLLRTGENRLVLRSTDVGRPPAVLVDAVPRACGGLGLLSDTAAWTAERDGHPVGLHPRHRQWQDPRFACLLARPHPLPRASWLERPDGAEGVVLDVVPDLDPADSGPRLLRFVLPVGATAFTVPTDLRFSAEVDGRPVPVAAAGEVRLPAPAAAGTTATLRFDAAGGRRAGALVDAAVTVATAAAGAPLADWTELGLTAMAGEVVYRRDVTAEPARAGERLVLDLGTVRGSVEVGVDGERLASLAWSPYRVDVTDSFAGPGPHRVEVTVRNTLAGYLASASPTPAVFAGQERAGMHGPVRLVRHAPAEHT